VHSRFILLHPIGITFCLRPLREPARAGRLCEKLSIADPVGVGVVILPPGRLARVPGRLGEDKRPLCHRCGVLEDPKMVVVEDAQRFDGVGDGDATIPDEQQVLSVLGVGRRREVVRPQVDTGRRRPYKTRPNHA